MKIQKILKDAKGLANSIEQAKSTVKGIKDIADSIGVAGWVGKNKEAGKEPKADEKSAPKSAEKPAEDAKTAPLPAPEVVEAVPAVAEEKPMEIDSLEGMTNWLSSLQAGASLSVQQALKAQLQVIQFVQSPTLVDTTIDTLVLNLKKSLEGEQDPDMKKTIHERFSLMIQNYVFFLDARLQMEINNNKEEAMRLYDMAGDMLSHSVVDIAMLATPGGIVAKGAKFVVKNVFAGNNEATGNFLGSLVKYLWAKNDKDQKVADFYKTIYGIIMKLDKYSGLIGKSMLISNMIDRYTPNLADYEFTTETSSFDELKDMIGIPKQKNKPKLLRENINAIQLQDQIADLETELKEQQNKLKEMGDPWLPAKKRAKRELAEKVEGMKSELKAKQKELRDEYKFARIRFEESLHAIAEKFNEL